MSIEPPEPFKYPLLMSYAFLRALKRKQTEAIIGCPEIELLLDSGGFTAKNAGEEIDLGEYIAFLQDFGPSLFAYVALDKLQDPEQSERNLSTMIEAGLKPVPVHVYGDDEKRMNELFKLSDYVALGGLRRPHRGKAPKSYVVKKMEWARDRKVHWLGYTEKPMIAALKPFSCDCASAVSGIMYGHCDLYMGGGKFLGFTYEQFVSKHISLRREVVARLARYGSSVKELMDQDLWTNDDKDSGRKALDTPIYRVPMRGWLEYSMDVRQLYGTRFFIAILPSQFPQMLAQIKAIEHLGVNL